MSSSSYFDARKRNYGAHYDEDESIIKDIEDICNDPKMKIGIVLNHNYATRAELVVAIKEWIYYY